MIYTAPWVMLVMWAASVTWASGRGLGPGNREFFRPCEMAPSYVQVPTLESLRVHRSIICVHTHMLARDRSRR
jgi:hypothetical protein